MGQKMMFEKEQERIEKPLLVGEINPYGADPDFALYPEPRGATGDRLCRLILGMRSGQYMERFERVNLCEGKWSIRKARERASRLLAGRPPHLVLLGSKVCSAFGLEFTPFQEIEYCAPELESPVTTVVLPHPSGLCRLWNEAGAFERARMAVLNAGISI